MKAIMISINPKWCESIANGNKTIEVRKTRPKIDTPFKCYIYETKGKTETPTFINEDRHCIYQGRGQVIGEFICDEIIEAKRGEYGKLTYKETLLDVYDLLNYADEKNIYGWKISNLKIYDKPKELSEYKKINRECWYSDLGLAKRDCQDCKNADCFVQKAPQSWCYVEVEE